MMSNGYEYAKANMLQSLENARTYTSYMGETDDEMRWKLDEDIAAFKQKIEQAEASIPAFEVFFSIELIKES